MQIKKVDVFPLGYPEPNDDNAARYITLERIEAGDGNVGWRECISQFRESTYGTEDSAKRTAAKPSRLASDLHGFRFLPPFHATT